MFQKYGTPQYDLINKFILPDDLQQLVLGLPTAPRLDEVQRGACFIRWGSAAKEYLSLATKLGWIFSEEETLKWR